MTAAAVALLDPSLPEVEELQSELAGTGHAVRRLPVPSAPWLERRLCRRGFEPASGSIPLALAKLRLEDPLLVHAFGAPLGYAAGRWSRRTGRPAIVSLTVAPTREWLMARRRRLQFVVDALEDGATCVVTTQFAADALRRALGADGRVIAPGIDVRRFPVPVARAEAPTIAHLGPWPSATAERALRLLRSRVGDLDVTAAERSGDAGAAWLTLVTGDPADDPLSAVRSLATGTPVVVRRASGGAEVIDDPQLGLLADDDPESLCEALHGGLELVHQAATAERCRARAEEFSVERWARACGELYAELRA